MCVLLTEADTAGEKYDRCLEGKAGKPGGQVRCRETGWGVIGFYHRQSITVSICYVMTKVLMTFADGCTVIYFTSNIFRESEWQMKNG